MVGVLEIRLKSEHLLARGERFGERCLEGNALLIPVITGP